MIPAFDFLLLAVSTFLMEWRLDVLLLTTVTIAVSVQTTTLGTPEDPSES